MDIYQRIYNTKNPYGVYMRQRANARGRGILWEISFEDWWSVWQQSGKWEERGREAHQYCMSRKNDDGPYSVENVRIVTMKENSQERHHWNLASKPSQKYLEKW